MFALFYLIFSIWISISWIIDIACSFWYFIAIYLVTFVALIPGFNFVFMFISLLCHKKEKNACIKSEKILFFVYFSFFYLYYFHERWFFLTNINCCENCIYQKEGKCCFENINNQKITFHPDCAYFIKAKQIPPKQD